MTIDAAWRALDEHCTRERGNLLTRGHAASERFDKLYTAWIQARWDAGDPWVRAVWIDRPT